MVVLLEDRQNKEKLVQKILRNTPEKHHEMILSAIELMEESHKGQKRLSGEEFFFHPLNVGAIVADMNLDSTSIITALLHNTIRERSPKERHKILSEIEAKFTIEIASMVRRIEFFSHGTRSRSDSDTITKFIMRSGKDLRLIIIKLADRLDNARTVNALDEKKQKEVANNLIKIYSPLCTYLNLYEFKKELEEIAFRILKPNDYLEIDNYISELNNINNSVVEKSIIEIKDFSTKFSKSPHVYGRVKSHYSLYRKLKGKKKYANVRDVQDLFAFTVLVDSESECFNIAKHLFRNTDIDLPSYDDYITKPKANGYKGLHIVTVLPDITDNQVEIQVKTRKMHHFNMYGPASHIYYSGYKDEGGNKKNYFWIKGVHKQMYQYHSQRKEDFSSPLESNIFRNRVFVLTPKKRLIELPIGSTPVDFAYKLHSSVGNKAIGCTVNGEDKPLSHELRNGDIVEIIKDQEKVLPDHEWLHFVRTRRARESIENEHRKILMNSDQEFVHSL